MSMVFEVKNLNDSQGPSVEKESVESELKSRLNE